MKCPVCHQEDNSRLRTDRPCHHRVHDEFAVGVPLPRPPVKGCPDCGDTGNHLLESQPCDSFWHQLNGALHGKADLTTLEPILLPYDDGVLIT